MDDVLALQIVQRQGHLTEVEFDSVLAELDILLQVVAQISSQQEVDHHEHVLLVLEGVPEASGGKRHLVAASTAERKHMLHRQKQRLKTQQANTQLVGSSMQGKHDTCKACDMHLYRNLLKDRRSCI